MVVETICPLLTLGGNPRVVAGAPDAAHRCAAGGSLSEIDRSHQIRFCLSGGYETCERFRTHVTEVGPVGPTWAAAAPDATFVSTRLVMESGPRVTLAPPSPRRWPWAVIALGLVAAGVATAWLALGGLNRVPGATPTATPSALPSSAPSGSVDPSATGGASPTEAPTATPATTPIATALSTPVTYIVQSGDTLNSIAARFGTTAQAIREANGLTSDLIHPGQVLIIPPP